MNENKRKIKTKKTIIFLYERYKNHWYLMSVCIKKYYFHTQITIFNWIMINIKKRKLYMQFWFNLRFLKLSKLRRDHQTSLKIQKLSFLDSLWSKLQIYEAKFKEYCSQSIWKMQQFLAFKTRFFWSPCLTPPSKPKLRSLRRAGRSVFWQVCHKNLKKCAKKAWWSTSTW